MHMKRTNSQSYIKNRHSSGYPQRTSDRYTLKDDKPIQTTSSNNGVLLKKSEKFYNMV